MKIIIGLTLSLLVGSVVGVGRDCKEVLRGLDVCFANGAFNSIIERDFYPPEIDALIVSSNETSTTASYVPSSWREDWETNIQLPYESNRVIPGNAFASLKNLGSLDLSDINIRHLDPLAFNGLLKLDRLDLSRNHHWGSMSNFTGVFSNLPNLQDLDLRGNDIEDIPHSIFDSLTSLETLDLRNNKLTTMTAINLPSLRTLNLNNNLLTSIPDGIFNKLTSLETLLMSNNRLTTLPVMNLPLLEDLILDNNNISNIPDGAFVNLPALGALILDDNQLKIISVRNLPALKMLSLTNNQLTTMSVQNLPALRIISLTHNRLTTIPAIDRRGIDLLKLGSNNITRISPRGFGRLTHIRSKLELSDNPISAIETDSFNGFSVQCLNISSNNLQELAPRAFNGLTVGMLNLTFSKCPKIHIDAFAGLEATLLKLNYPELCAIPKDAFKNTTIKEYLVTPELERNVWNWTAREERVYPGIRNEKLSDYFCGFSYLFE